MNPPILSRPCSAARLGSLRAGYLCAGTLGRDQPAAVRLLHQHERGPRPTGTSRSTPQGAQHNVKTALQEVSQVPRRRALVQLDLLDDGGLEHLYNTSPARRVFRLRSGVKKKAASVTAAARASQTRLRATRHHERSRIVPFKRTAAAVPSAAKPGTAAFPYRTGMMQW